MFFWRWLRIVLDKFLNVWELSLDILEVALYILKVAVDILGIAVDIFEVALDILEIALDILEIALALWQTKRPTPLLNYTILNHTLLHYDMFLLVFSIGSIQSNHQSKAGDLTVPLFFLLRGPREFIVVIPRHPTQAAVRDKECHEGTCWCPNSMPGRWWDICWIMMNHV